MIEVVVVQPFVRSSYIINVGRFVLLVDNTVIHLDQRLLSPPILLYAEQIYNDYTAISW